eukprot:7109592-Lingulodinium_polyedra.AAC.1
MLPGCAWAPQLIAWACATSNTAKHYSVSSCFKLVHTMCPRCAYDHMGVSNIQHSKTLQHQLAGAPLMFAYQHSNSSKPQPVVSSLSTFLGCATPPHSVS